MFGWFERVLGIFTNHTEAVNISINIDIETDLHPYQCESMVRMIIGRRLVIIVIIAISLDDISACLRREHVWRQRYYLDIYLTR